MTDLLAQYVAQINVDFPTLDIITARLNRDGMVNDVVIVNEDLVFRFAKNDDGRALLVYEAQVLDVVGHHVRAPVPLIIHRTGTYMHYRFVPGTPLYRHLLLRATSQVQDRLAQDLATFLAELHAIPLAGIPAHPRTGAQPPTSRTTPLQTAAGCSGKGYLPAPVGRPKGLDIRPVYAHYGRPAGPRRLYPVAGSS